MEPRLDCRNISSMCRKSEQGNEVSVWELHGPPKAQGSCAIAMLRVRSATVATVSGWNCQTAPVVGSKLRAGGGWKCI